MDRNKVEKLIAQLADIRTNFYNKDFLLTWNHSDPEIRAILLTAEILENFYEGNVSTRVFQGGLSISNFRDKSTRTRFSFASASSLLGLSYTDLDETKTQIAHGETVRETANMISFATEVIGIRDDMFIGEGHEYMKETSDSVELGYKDGVLPQRPAIINLQCDRDHPTQSIADLLHLQKTFGGLDKLKGKKIAMTWAYSPAYAKPLSVPQGIITLMTRMGMDVHLAAPEGYDLQKECIDVAHKHAKASGGKFTVSHSMDEAFKDADIVYPKSWGSMSLMLDRTKALRAGESKKVADIDKAGLEASKKYIDWECNEARMKTTRDGKALYMHCLPADITDVNCKQGEVAKTVFERYRNPTYCEAMHKHFGMASMILNTRFEKPAEILAKLLKNGTPRRGL